MKMAEWQRMRRSGRFAIWKRLTVAAYAATVATALRGIVRLPENFDEREFKSERLTSRFRVWSFARFAGRWTAEEAVAFNDLTQRIVDEDKNRGLIFA